MSHTLEDVVELWKAGNQAPYNLFDLNGVLVENVFPIQKPVIVAGAPISRELAQRIKEQLLPPPRPAVKVPIVQYNEDGTPMLDTEGNAIVVLTEVVPKGAINELSYKPSEVPYDEDMHCDMCGVEFEALYSIGDGWFCKVPRIVRGLDKPETCFDVRLMQLKEMAQEQNNG